MKQMLFYGILSATTLVATLRGAERELVLCLKGIDPVELVSGKQTPGLAEFSATRGIFKYQFANAANKKAFEASPEKYAAQYGGSCARTGPLSPLADPARFLVHGERIYLFDSESCQKAFIAAPDKFIELEDLRPDGTADQARDGAKLVERALQAMGGVSKVDGVTSYETRYVLKRNPENRGEDSTYTNTVLFPDSFRRDERSSTGTGASVVKGADGFRAQGDVWWKMEPMESAYLRRIYQRDPLVLLRARNSPGFLAYADGKGKLGDRELEFVRIWLDGMTCWLGLDPANGRVMAVRYRGRVMGRMGMLVKVQSDFRDVEGLSIPFGASLAFDGEPIPGSERTLDAVTINAKVDPTLFERPK